MKARLPAVEEIVRHWPIIEPMLRRATARSHGCYEPIDLLAAIMRGEMACWLVQDGGIIKAIAVTAVRQYPRRRVVEIVMLAGRDLRSWESVLRDALDAHAREAGADAIVGYGRPGWVHAGARVVGTVLIRKVQ